MWDAAKEILPGKCRASSAYIEEKKRWNMSHAAKSKVKKKRDRERAQRKSTEGDNENQKWRKQKMQVQQRRCDRQGRELVLWESVKGEPWQVDQKAKRRERAGMLGMKRETSWNRRLPVEDISVVRQVLNGRPGSLRPSPRPAVAAPERRTGPHRKGGCFWEGENQHRGYF